MSDKPNQLGQLLRQTREQAGLSRDELARRIRLDASYIYRLETGDRRPSREVTLALAEALGVKGESMDQWLIAAGYTPQPLLNMLRGAVSTRGGRRGASEESKVAAHWSAARWAEWLEGLGLQEGTIRRLLQAMDKAKLTERQEISRTISTAIVRAAEVLESPIRTAIIPAAGKQQRIIATHILQQLLLRAIGEALESGLSNVVLVLAPGSAETLYAPIKEALSLAVAPVINLHYCEQASPDGLGAAILQAQSLVTESAFAVLLPDDIVRDRVRRAAPPRELRRMIEARKQVADAHLVAVTSLPKAKMVLGGIARLRAKNADQPVFPIRQLLEKPEPHHPIYRDQQAYGIVGRYLLNHSIFRPLYDLHQAGRRPVQLTDALEALRQEGEAVYAYELTAARQDVGEVLGQANELFGIVLNQHAHADLG